MDRPKPGDTYPELRDADREAAAVAIMGELTWAAINSLDLNIGWAFVEDNQDRARRLQAGFLRARRIRHVLAGDRQWQTTTGLSRLARSSTEAPEVALITTLLLELVILSRVEVDDPYKGIHHSVMGGEIDRLRGELGIAEGFLPGATFDTVVEAVCDGRIRIGNPDQPDPYGVHLPH